ncbi:YncE family protein [Methylocella sp.]|uniref:YncE family protein n=1 Tax=Methylocella sp. TaxID=1978226 RepID=UPI0035B3C055
MSGAPTAIFTNARRNSVYIVHKSGAAGAERTGVAVIDVATNALVADIALGRGDFDVRAPSDGDWLAVLNKSAGTLVTINAKTNAVVATIPLGGLARAFDVRPDGLQAFVLRRRDDGVADIVVVNIPDATLFGNIETNFDLDKAPFGVVKVDPIGNGGAVVAPVPSRYNSAATIYFPAAGWTYPQADLPPMYESDGLWGTLSIVFSPYGNPMFQLAPGAVAERFNYDLFGGVNFAGRPGQSALTPDNRYLFVPISSDQPGRTGLEMIWAQPMYKDGAVIPFTSISDVAIVEPQLGAPFEKLAIAYLDIAHRATAGEDLFNFYGEVTTYASFDTFRPDVRGMTVEVGAFKTTIPSGKFKKASDGSHVYNAWVDGVVYNAYVRPLGNYKYTAHLLLRYAPLPQIANPAQVRLSFGVLGGLQATIATIR